jgi:hypothetical protein
MAFLPKLVPWQVKQDGFANSIRPGRADRPAETGLFPQSQIPIPKLHIPPREESGWGARALPRANRLSCCHEDLGVCPRSPLFAQMPDCERPNDPVRRLTPANSRTIQGRAAF